MNNFHGKCHYREPTPCCNKIIKFLLLIFPALNGSQFKKTFSSQHSVMEISDTNSHIKLPRNIKLYHAFFKIHHFLNDIFMSMLVTKKHGGVHWHKFPVTLHKIFEHFYYQYLVKTIKVVLHWWTCRTPTKPTESVSTYAHSTAIAQPYRIWQV
jgi:hypothetical protein